MAACACPPAEDLIEGGPASLFARNRAWAQAKLQIDPHFFDRLVGQQKPNFFWIGCSDSRVPATEIVDLVPGEMFVHRNVANLAIAEDPNFAAALQFAVEVLKVRHIMVVGHYGCGGIEAAMAEQSDDAVGQWLKPVRKLFHQRRHDIVEDDQPAHRLCEVNVAAQVAALAQNSIVQAAWERGAALNLHGWIYAIGDGLLRQVLEPVFWCSDAIRRPEMI